MEPVCASHLSVAVTKHQDQRQLTGERVYLGFMVPDGEIPFIQRKAACPQKQRDRKLDHFIQEAERQIGTDRQRQKCREIEMQRDRYT